MKKEEPVVYVVQKQMRFDNNKGELVPRFDLEPAREYGRFVYLLSPTASPFKAASVLADMKKHLKNFTNQDHLLLIGNPCLIGFAVALATFYNNGRVNMLQWSGKEGRYLPVSGEIY